MNALQKATRSILDTLFPDYCIGCHRINTLLCAQCLKKIPEADNPEYSFIHPLLSYRSPVLKEVVHRLKYKNTRRLAAIFGATLYEHLIDITGDNISFSNEGRIILIPIPLHKKRLRERGYNQSELLIEAILAHDTGNIFSSLPQALTRTRDTAPQARSEKKSLRLANLRDAFACLNPGSIRGKAVILVDDVSTTGATLDEARRALLKAKPRVVIAITLAH